MNQSVLLFAPKVVPVFVRKKVHVFALTLVLLFALNVFLGRLKVLDPVPVSVLRVALSSAKSCAVMRVRPTSRGALVEVGAVPERPAKIQEHGRQSLLLYLVAVSLAMALPGYQSVIAAVVMEAQETGHQPRLIAYLQAARMAMGREKFHPRLSENSVGRNIVQKGVAMVQAIAHARMEYPNSSSGSFFAGSNAKLRCLEARRLPMGTSFACGCARLQS